MSGASPQPDATSSIPWGWFAALVLIGLCLRTLAARGELWLDEILSINAAHAAHGLTDVFADRQDNNHLLNTIILHLLPAHAPALVYRVHSIIAGAATIVLAGLFAMCWGRVTAIFAATIFASAFILVHYGSEARGYSMLACCVLGSLLAVDRGLEKNSWPWAAVFWCAAIAGVLAHALFIQAWLAIVAWSIWRLAFSARRWSQRLVAAGMYHIIPAAGIAVVYLTFISKLRVLGADRSNTWVVIRQTAAYTLGLPQIPLAMTVAAALCVVMVAVACVLGQRLISAQKHGAVQSRSGLQRFDIAVLLAMLSVGAPLLVLLGARPEFVLPRYFIVPVMAVLLSVAVVLGRLHRLQRPGRLASITLLLAWVLGNAVYSADLLLHGRGHYQQALAFIVAHSTRTPITIAGDHDFRHPPLVQWYAQELAEQSATGSAAQSQPPPAIRYVRREDAAVLNPEWVLVHSFDPAFQPPRTARDFLTRTCELCSRYDTGPLAGWRLFVYQRQ